jgi:hypothetical protein
MKRSTSLFGQSGWLTAGTGGLRIGWNDQNARCSGVMVTAEGFAAAGFDAGGADAVDAAGAGVAAGQAAPAPTHSESASISVCDRRSPPFGIFSFSSVCRTA